MVGSPVAERMDRETLSRFHQPDRRLAEHVDKRESLDAAGKREIDRAYYREKRAEMEANGEGRRYADRRDMANTGRRDRPVGMLGPTPEAKAEQVIRTNVDKPRARGRLFSIGWEPKKR